MKSCAYCGAENVDTAQFCDVCGTEVYDLPDQKKRNKGSENAGGWKKWAAIGVCALVLVAAVITLMVVLSNRTDAFLSKACVDAVDDLISMVEEKSELVETIQGFARRIEDGEFNGHAEVNTNGFVLSSDFAYDRSKKLLSGTANCDIAQLKMDVGVDYSADKESFQIAFKEGSYNVYGFKYDQLRKSYGSSLLSKVLPITIPEDFGANLFEKPDWKNFRKEILNIIKSVDIKELNERDIKIGGKTQCCKIYRLRWDEEAFEKFVGKANNVIGSAELTGLLKDFLPKVEPECLCIVNESGQLVGVDVVSMGRQYVFMLEGDDNLWEEFSLTETTLSGNTVRYTGSMVKEDSVVRLVLENGNVEFFKVEYDEDNGQFAVITGANGKILSGRISNDRDQIMISIVWYNKAHQPQEICFAVMDLEDSPKKLSNEYSNILQMNLSEWQRLFLEVGADFPIG